MADAHAQYGDLISALERENQSVHDSLTKMRLRIGVPTYIIPTHGPSGPLVFHYKMQYELVMWNKSIAALGLLVGGLVAFSIVLGPPIIRFVAAHWRAVLLCMGAASVGAALAVGLGQVGFRPLQKLSPPDAHSDEPLRELERLAERTAQRLRAAYRIQVCLLAIVFAGFIAVVAWTMALVSQERMAYASAFGSGSVAMLILSKWKWQPFDRVAQARRLADQADVLATALRLRMRTIQEIEDPVARAKAQWEAAGDYLKLS